MKIKLPFAIVQAKALSNRLGFTKLCPSYYIVQSATFCQDRATSEVLIVSLGCF